MTDTVAAHPVTYALGYALVRFLWQGAVIGLATAVLLTLARRAAPTTRYAIGCLGLFALAATPVATFLRAMLVAVGMSGTAAQGTRVLTGFADGAPVVAGPSFELFAALSAAAWSSEIVMVWSAGVLLLAARLLVGWRPSHGSDVTPVPTPPRRSPT